MEDLIRLKIYLHEICTSSCTPQIGLIIFVLGVIVRHENHFSRKLTFRVTLLHKQSKIRAVPKISKKHFFAVRNGQALVSDVQFAQPGTDVMIFKIFSPKK
jgi:hypothetical protein